jgi:RNA polymerase sigma factor (sigma-70 family)
LKDIRRLIANATAANAALAERHAAFGELVLRFQDMAFACAYAVLSDAFLAEDVAQESFVTAWQKLTQLREPEAFPGWFKRIVLTQCNRLTRGKRLQLLPLEHCANKATADLGPEVAAEEHELVNKVMTAIKALPDNERLVTTLFYIDGYTQVDIGEFLELPVTTVNKRLYVARQKLRKSVVEIEVFRENLKRSRPSRDRSFSDRVSAKLRPFTANDWPPVQTMASAREQDDGSGNDAWQRNRQSFDDTQYERRQYVVEQGTSNQILGYGSIEQSVYLPKYRMFIVTDPRWLEAGVGELLLERLTADLLEVGAVTVSCREYASQSELVEFLKANGFEESGRQLDLRLDLRGTLPEFTRPRNSRITISTLAEERVTDPLWVEKLHDLSTALYLDDPARGPLTPPGYFRREALLWLERPYVLPDGYFIAKDGDRYVGLTDVNLLDAVPGGVTQGFTGVLRDYRRQGIATALKLRCIEYAREKGYRLIQALIRPVHAEMLALNEKLGFKTLFSYVTLEKCLKEVISVDPEVYDNYAGRFLDESRPDLELAIRNEGGRLTCETIGQKVELFPTTQTHFFVQYFYGEATFYPDESGTVDSLKFELPAYKNRKASILMAKRIS